MSKPNFTQPVAIEIENEEMRDRLIKGLEGLGYQWASTSQDVQRFPMLVVKDDCYLMLTELYRKSSYPCTILVQSESALLALAAMTDSPEGIAGEWWVHIEGRRFWTVGKMYQAQRPINKEKAFIDDTGNLNGLNGISNTGNMNYFRKATVQEILEHFGEENMGEEKKDTIGIEVGGLSAKLIGKIVRKQDLTDEEQRDLQSLANFLDPQPQTIIAFERVSYGHHTTELSVEDALKNKNVYASIAESEAHDALRQLQIKRDEYNGQPLAEWLKWDVSQNNFYIMLDGSLWVVAQCWQSWVSPALYFKTRELAEQFLKDHADLLERLMPIVKGVV